MGKFYEGISDELILYARHLAWLNAVPEKTDKARSEVLGEELEMPPCDALHIIGFLFEIGPSISTGMGEAPLMHSEIAAWQQNTGVELTAWEARIVRLLSIEYLAESRRAVVPTCPAPWSHNLALKLVAKDMKASISGLTQL